MGSDLDDLGTRIAATRARMTAPTGLLCEPDPAIPYERNPIDSMLFRQMAVVIGVSSLLREVDQPVWVRFPAAFLAGGIYLAASRWWRAR